MVARIFKPAKSAMQSGRGKTEDWVLEHISEQPRGRDPLMGYTSSTETENQVRLSFDTLEEAENYAVRNNIAYVVMKPKERAIKRVAYSDNFKYGRMTPWTH
ncbi:MAG: ETC complex I subunit [Rhizobiales bacterium]|nr:ETC complex I subunit [Hyphomicrobiales bacterium]